MNKHELEERLINFAVLIIDIANDLPNTKTGIHLSGQLVRSGTSSALNYGEAQSGVPLQAGLFIKLKLY